MECLCWNDGVQKSVLFPFNEFDERRISIVSFTIQLLIVRQKRTIKTKEDKSALDAGSEFAIINILSYQLRSNPHTISDLTKNKTNAPLIYLLMCLYYRLHSFLKRYLHLLYISLAHDKKHDILSVSVFNVHRMKVKKSWKCHLTNKYG